VGTAREILFSYEDELELISEPDVSLNLLLMLWNSHDIHHWSLYPKLYSLLAERIIRFGEPLLAYDIIDEGLIYWKDDIRLKQLLALTLVRSKIPQKANDILLQLYSEGDKSEETLGLLARTYKDLWKLTKDKKEKSKYIDLSKKNIT